MKTIIYGVFVMYIIVPIFIYIYFLLKVSYFPDFLIECALTLPRSLISILRSDDQNGKEYPLYINVSF